MQKLLHGKVLYKSVSLVVVFALFVSLFQGSFFLRAQAYSESLGNVLSATKSGNKVVLTVANSTGANDTLTLEVCKSDVLRVDYQPASAAVSADTPMIDPNLSWDTAMATISTSTNPITITTSDMKIEIAKTPCRMTVKKANGTTLFYEPTSGGVYYNGVRFVRQTATNLYGIHGYDCFTQGTDITRNDTSGEATAGQQGNSGGPFMWSTGGYGILVDSDGGYPYTNTSEKKMEFYYGDNTTSGRRYNKTDVEYYIMLGEPKEIMSSYSKITGTSPMMPKWSLGFSNFEWGVNESEMTSMIDTYRAKNIPLDAYGMDYDWKEYGSDNYGEFTWNTDNFPSASTNALKTTMNSKGVKLIGITKPRIVTKLSNGTETEQGAYASSHNFFYPGHSEYTDYFYPVTVQSIDPYNSAERTWFWQHSQNAFDKGIVGWWNDETDKVSSNGASFWFGNFTTLFLSQGIFEGQKSYTNGGTRVWQTARSYYPGTQRYGTSLWSGDVATQFKQGERVDWAVGLNEQKVAMLSTVNNGQPKWGCDGGGFNSNSGNIENPSPELYTRWLQFASVVPVFRVHGQYNQQRQPWYFGTTAEEVTKAAIQQRYSLIPYMYSYEHNASVTGLGLVHPLIFDYPNDSNVANYSDAWMFGDYILTAPVTERGQSVKWIYLPAGQWIDYNRGVTYQGGQYIPYSLNSESWSDLPMFVKEGGIIPTQDVEDYIGQKSINKIKFDIFPSATATSFDYYDDDGESYSYENGSFFKQTVTASKTSTTATVNVSAKTGSYNNNVSYYYLAIHNNGAATVKDNGTALTECADYNALLARSGEGFAVSKDVYGDVTYVKVAAGASSAKNIVLSGSDPATVTSSKYEAEYASLSGKTTATKAAVNNDHTGFSGTGFAANFTNDDAAATFYSKVENAGDYPVSLRYSNGTSSSKNVSVYVNGVFVKQAELPTTANWNTWASANVELPLAAGSNSIMIKYDTDAGDSGNINLDYIEVPFYPNRINAEAENAALYGSAAVNADHYYYSGSGFVDGITSVGASAKFTAILPEAGTYNATLRYCNGTQATKNLNLYVNGSFSSTVSLPSNGSDWNAWQTVSLSIPASAGTNTIELKHDSSNSGNVNLDKLTIPLLSGETVSENLLDNGDFERSTFLASNWTQWYPSNQSSAFGIDSGSGSNPPDSPYDGDKRAYFYSAGNYQQSIHQEVSLKNGTYTLEAWARVQYAAPTTCRMEVSNHGGSAIYTNLPSSGSGWQKVIVKNISVSSGQMDVGFYCDSNGGTVVHLDGIKLYKQ